MVQKYPKVSIVVPVLNRERTIDACIRSLLDLDYPSYEILVVDNGSTDNTVEIVSKYPVKLIHESVKGAYVARNIGLKEASGPLVLFMDSDCIANRNLLKQLVSKMEAMGAAGVGGPLQSHNPLTLVERSGHYAGILQYSLPEGYVSWDRKKFLSGCIFTSNALLRKKIVEAFGYFDDTFKSGGDYDLCWRLQRAGHQIYFESAAAVYHIHRSDIRGLVKQFFKYGFEQPRLLKKPPEGKSYIKIKSYVFPHVELSPKWPFRILVNIDSISLLPFCVTLSLFWPVFFYASIILSVSVLSGTLWQAARVAIRSKDLRWFLLFPFFHLLRNYAFTMGRIWGGIKQGIVSF